MHLGGVLVVQVHIRHPSAGETRRDFFGKDSVFDLISLALVNEGMEWYGMEWMNE